VTATVIEIEIDLYVYWKPGFRIKMKASLGIDDLTDIGFGFDGSIIGVSMLGLESVTVAATVFALYV